MTALQWIVLGLAALNIVISGWYVVLPTLRELHEREEEEVKPEKARGLFLGDDSGFLELDEQCRRARPRRLIAVGVTLGALTGHFGGFLREQVLEHGLQLEGFLINPQLLKENPDLCEKVAEHWGKANKEEFAKRVDKSIAYFRDLKNDLEIRKEDPERVQLWGINTIPSLGLAIFDPDEPRASIRVSLYTFKSKKRRHPILLLSLAGADAEEYAFFYEYYKRVLRESTRLLQTR